MTLDNFMIDYTCLDTKGDLIKGGTFRVKNRYNGVQAQADLEKFLKKKYSNFGRMIVTKCKKEDFWDTLMKGVGKDSDPFTQMFGKGK